jgi:hypothetical protein
MVADELTLALDLAGTVAQSGIDPTLKGRELQNTLRSAIASRRGSCDWTVDHAGWVVTLLSPEEETFYGRTLEEALGWCLVWLMAPEIGVGPFVV